MSEDDDQETTLAQYVEAVKSIDPDAESWNPDDEGFRVAVVLLVSAWLGPDLIAICRFTGYHAEWLGQIAERLTVNGIWKDGQVHGNWFDEEHGGMDLLIDVNVGLGLFERADS